MLPMFIESYHVHFSLFFFFTIRTTPVHVIEKALQNSSPVSCSISPITQLKNQCITESGTLFNSTILITFILLLILLYKKKCFVYFPRNCPFYSLSVNVQCFSLWYLFFNCMLHFPVPCYYVFFFYLISEPPPPNCWIVKLNTHTHWTVNYGGIFD